MGDVDTRRSMMGDLASQNHTAAANDAVEKQKHQRMNAQRLQNINDGAGVRRG